MPWEKQFDVDVALQKAGETFWSHGYEATSVRDLLGAMGIQKGSFYDTYGSKHEAYLASLDKYVDDHIDIFEQVSTDLSPREALTAQINWIYEACIGSKGSRGCMVVNGALELAPSDPEAKKRVLNAMSRHEQVHVNLIRQGQAEGDIDKNIDALKIGRAMLGLVFGMRVYTRAGATKETIRALADQAIELLGS